MIILDYNTCLYNYIHSDLLFYLSRPCRTEEVVQLWYLAYLVSRKLAGSGQAQFPVPGSCLILHLCLHFHVHQPQRPSRQPKLHSSTLTRHPLIHNKPTICTIPTPDSLLRYHHLSSLAPRPLRRMSPPHILLCGHSPS